MARLLANVAYSAVSTAITRFEKRLKVDRELQRRIKRNERFCSFAEFAADFSTIANR